MHLRPLTHAEKTKKSQLIGAYSDFWNNIRFRQGWQKPIFLKEEVLPLLDRAAEIVIRKRTELDAKSTEFKMRMVDGSAREYLWTVKEHPISPTDKTKQKENEFVQQLVHATFKDGNGYVEGLTKEEIDEFILEIQSKLDQSLPVMDRVNKILSTLFTIVREVNEEADSLILELYNQPNTSEKAQKFSNSLIETEKNAIAFYKAFHTLKQQFVPEKAEEESPGTSSESDDESSVLQNASRSLRTSTNSLPVQNVEHVENTDILVEDLPESSPELLNSPAVQPSKIDHPPAEALSSEAADIEPAHSDTDESSNLPEHSTEVPSNQATESEQPAASSEEPKQAELSPQSAASAEAAEDIEPAHSDTSFEQPEPTQESSKEEELEKQKQEQERLREEERRIQREEARQRQLLFEQAEKRRKKEEEAKNRVNRWSRVKFEPKFDISERTDGFILTSFLPGMNKEDINLKYDKQKSTLTISGFKPPTIQEEQKLQADLHKSLAYRFGNRYQNRYTAQELDEFLLKMGSDSFGSFNETYKLPNYVDFNNISCSYEGGVLRVVVPVVQGAKHRRAQPQTRRTPYIDDYFASPFYSSPRGFW